jgi:SSS family solute:Na+ symporter
MVLNMAAKDIFPAILQSPINCGVIAMVGNLIILPVVSMFTKKPSKELVEDAFSCYEQDVVVKSKKSLNS